MKRLAALFTGLWLLVACFVWSSVDLGAQIRAGINYATGVITFLQTPSSANLATAITDEQGSGKVVFDTSPSLTTPDIGVATGTSLFTTLNGIGSFDGGTSDDSVRLFNSTAATVGTTIQASPSLRFQGSDWISSAAHPVQMLMGLQGATSNMIDGRPGHTLFWYSATDGNSPVEAMRLQGNGNLITKSSIDAAFNNSDVGDVSTAAGGTFYFRNTSDGINPTRAVINSTAQGKIRFHDSNQSNKKVELNIGTATPTVTTCGTSPTVGSNSNNVVGSLATGSGATACTLNFGSPNWTATPFCFFYSTTDNAMLALTAASASAYTFTVGASKTVWWHCLGNN